MLVFNATLDVYYGLRALDPFKGSEGYPGLFQDFADGYIKL